MRVATADATDSHARMDIEDAIEVRRRATGQSIGERQQMTLA
jgi:hypothetical protein